MSAEDKDLLARFDQLQRRLRPLWANIGRTDPGGQILESPNTLVVLPSMTVDLELDFPSQQAYEERMLFMLFLLRQPNKRIIYITSMPVAPIIVDYYLHLLPSVTVSNARKRLFMISPEDASPRPLVNKLLERPPLLKKICSLLSDSSPAHLVPFLTTDYERELALQLDIPMYAADPRFFAFGTKSGARRVFAEEGVPHPLGKSDLRNEDDLVNAVADLRATKPSIGSLIVKHNDGVSGYGNATLSLADLPVPGAPDEKAAIRARLPKMQFSMHDADYNWYLANFEKKGGIVEERIVGDEIVSPSAQLRISPLGNVELLSTHDQLLGGEDKQNYQGAIFPANRAYGPAIMREAKKVGERFAREGVMGRFALDFMAVRNGSEWDVYAIEVNLRKGGTTHPFLTLQYLTDGSYNAEEGVYRTVDGVEKYYIVRDTVMNPAYKVMTPEAIFDLVSQDRLHYDHATQTGVVLHMISALGSLGRVGLTAIGNTPEQAEAFYMRFLGELKTASGA